MSDPLEFDWTRIVELYKEKTTLQSRGIRKLFKWEMDTLGSLIYVEKVSNKNLKMALSSTKWQLIGGIGMHGYTRY